MDPITIAISFDGTGTVTSVYAGPSYDAARTALGAALPAGTPAVGWLLRNVQPSTTMHPGDPTLKDIEKSPYMQPPLSDVPSAIGLSRLDDGRTVIAGDEERTEEMMENMQAEKDISGQQLEDAEREMIAHHRKEAHEFTGQDLKAQQDLVEEQQQNVENQYAETAGLEPRNVKTDYAESEHVHKQREREAQRAQSAQHASEAEIEAARNQHARQQEEERHEQQQHAEAEEHHRREQEQERAKPEQHSI